MSLPKTREYIKQILAECATIKQQFQLGMVLECNHKT